jgi:hypothetical protein
VVHFAEYTKRTTEISLINFFIKRIKTAMKTRSQTVANLTSSLKNLVSTSKITGVMLSKGKSGIPQEEKSNDEKSK